MKPFSKFREQNTLIFFVVFLVDLAVILGGCLLSYWLYLDRWPLNDDYREAIAAAALLVLVVFWLFDVHQLWRRFGLLDELLRVLVAWAVVAGLLIVLSAMVKVTAVYSRVWMGLWIIFASIGLVVAHAALRRFLRFLGQRAWSQRPVVVVGSGDLGGRLMGRFGENDWTGFQIRGVVGAGAESLASEFEDMAHGGFDELESIVESTGCQEVWVALPLEEQHQLKRIMERLRDHTVTIRFVPDMTDLRLINHSITSIAGFPMLNITESPMTFPVNFVIKTIEDRVLSALILIFISPLLLLIAIGVKLSSRGPVFYRQERVGWNGRSFEMLKFRSMPVDAEQESGPRWASQDDNRPTRFGAFLRRTSLDELPQFFNVLKGDMSIVGPRPERPVFVERFKQEIPDYMQKHLVRAGITGWAQVNGWRGNTDLVKRIEYDLYYIENWSLWFDLKIILMTMMPGIIQKNAY
ncbi:MAG: undecaprenyl-phosphate glucose phosphotransferase [Gammaproteobacteria bacterium]|jgi:putative colanic acid biosynthesis UDP-glucose lipid carrier transferase|nr:undecaprenyl-phosphate glucose phosphotransferase [Gammaproteobacteria bacterium]